MTQTAEPVAETAALRRRHRAAMSIVAQVDPGERMDLLAAVVWTDSPQLRADDEPAPVPRSRGGPRCRWRETSQP